MKKLFIFQLCCSGSPMNLKEFELLYFHCYSPQLMFILILPQMGVIDAIVTTNFKSSENLFFHSRLHCEVRFYLRKLKSVVACTVFSEMIILSKLNNAYATKPYVCMTMISQLALFKSSLGSWWFILYGLTAQVKIPNQQNCLLSTIFHLRLYHTIVCIIFSSIMKIYPYIYYL